MQLRHALSTLLLAAYCVGPTVGRHAFKRREETTDVTTGSRTSTSADNASRTGRLLEVSSSSTVHSRQAASTRSLTLSSSTSEATSSTTPATFETTSATSTVGASESSSSTQAILPSSTVPPGALPIRPKISPALGIAGALLMGVGAALALVGIKHAWLYIFLSTALLASLSVTVLIVYVMNPPVSDGIQGAYMAAAVVTGLIFGSVALLFKEVTDGLGCLLGGFCLAMWLLVLSAGGTIQSSSGRSIFIAIFSLAAFAFYFSRYTRHYALIISTAFAGAMTTVLGIDCFSRAGLKEFWLYLWRLNGKEFPFDTTTYPVTRGIRVEIACTFAIFLFGLISQFRLWKVVKEKRDRREADRVRWNESRDRLEEEIGRDVEARNERGLAHWENVYGDKRRGKLTDESGITSPAESLPKKSSYVHAVELQKLHGESSDSSKSDARPIITTRTSSEDEQVRAVTESQQPQIESGRLSLSSSPGSQTGPSKDHSGRGSMQEDAKLLHKQNGGGNLTHHPVPGLSAVPAGVEDRNRAWDERSIGSRLNRSSLPELDRASSVAATMDGDFNTEGLPSAPLSRATTPFPAECEQGDVEGSPEQRQRHSTLQPRRSMIEMPVEEDDDEAIVRPAAMPEESNREHFPRQSKKEGPRSHKWSPQDTVVGGLQGAQDHEGGSPGTTHGFTDQLPQRVSRAATQFRTNEWAKHITDADEPDLAMVSESLPGQAADQTFTEEQVRPVDIEDLQQARPGVERGSTSRSIYRQSSRASKLSPSTSAVPVYAFQNIDTSTSNSRPENRPRISTLGLRHASAPMTSQGMFDSPVEDMDASPTHHRNFSSPYETPSTNNLLDQRNSLMNRKLTSTSFDMLTQVADHDGVGPSDSANIRYAQTRDDDDNNMTLSERKASLQLQREREQMQSPIADLQHGRQSQGAWLSPAQSNNGAFPKPALIYDSHQPKRGIAVDTTRKTNALMQWRQELAADKAARQPLFIDENARQQMLTERRYTEWQHQRASYERAHRESIMDTAMRSGQLDGAHRDALRRMQAKANKKASG